MLSEQALVMQINLDQQDFTVTYFYILDGTLPVVDDFIKMF